MPASAELLTMPHLGLRDLPLPEVIGEEAMHAWLMDNVVEKAPSVDKILDIRTEVRHPQLQEPAATLTPEQLAHPLVQANIDLMLVVIHQASGSDTKPRTVGLSEPQLWTPRQQRLDWTPDEDQLAIIDDSELPAGAWRLSLIPDPDKEIVPGVQPDFIAVANLELDKDRPPEGWRQDMEGCFSSTDGLFVVTQVPERAWFKALDREGRPISLALSGLHAVVANHERYHTQEGKRPGDREDDDTRFFDVPPDKLQTFRKWVTSGLAGPSPVPPVGRDEYHRRTATGPWQHESNRQPRHTFDEVKTYQQSTGRQ